VAIYVVQVDVRPYTIHEFEKHILQERIPNAILHFVREQWSVVRKVVVGQRMLEECGDGA
jgi:hypothetical protein